MANQVRRYRIDVSHHRWRLVVVVTRVLTMSATTATTRAIPTSTDQGGHRAQPRARLTLLSGDR